MTAPWRGIWPIIITPFKADGMLDEDGLARVVRFCIDAGAQGLVGPANASEFTTLSDDERRRWLEVVVETAQGEVPVMASITSGHELPAVALGRFAQGLGVEAVMSMPPHILHPEASGCYRYYETLSGALDISICIQNFNGPIGTPMSAELISRMCEELPRIDYIKEETSPEPQQISATIKAAGQTCKGVWGGQGAIYIIDEFRRGAVGNMPGCHTTDILVALWEQLEVNDWDGARQIFNQLMPLMNYERLYGVAIYKEILYRRGILSSSMQRAPSKGLDELTLVELEAIMKTVEALYRI